VKQHKGSTSNGLVGRLQRSLGSLFAGMRLPSKSADNNESLQLFSSSGADMAEVYGHGDLRSGDRQTLNLTMEIINDAVRQRASDILIDPKDQTSHMVRLRVDGMLRTVRSQPIRLYVLPVRVRP